MNKGYYEDDNYLYFASEKDYNKNALKFFNKDVVVYRNDKNETSWFSFVVRLNNEWYRTVYEEEFPKCLERVEGEGSLFDEEGGMDIVYEIEEMVENWFNIVPNKAYWRVKNEV